LFYTELREDMPASGRTGPSQRPTRWLPVLVALLLLASAMYLRGFVHVLPYHLDPDEPNIWRLANHLKTTGRLASVYPPLRIADLALQFKLMDLLASGLSTQTAQFVVGRVSTILYTLLLLAVTYQAGRHLHSPAAGLAAMLFLLSQPDLFRLTKVFRVDNFAWLCGMTALLLTFRAVGRDRRRLILPAFIAGVAATLSKYTMLPVLIAPALVLMLYVPRTPLARGLVIGLAVLALAGGLLLVLSPPPLVADFLTSFHARQLYDREQVFRFVSLGRGWEGLLGQLGPVNFWGVLAAYSVAILGWPRSRLTRKQWLALGSVLLMALVAFFLIGLFQTNRPLDRYLIVLGFALLWGTALAMLTRQRVALALLAALLLTAPWLVKAWHKGNDLRLPDTRVMTAEWFIDNAPDGTHIALEYDRVEFDNAYGGFPGGKIFFTETIKSVHEDTLEGFARRGVEYLVADFRNVNRGGFFDPDTDDEAFLTGVETVLDLDNPYARGWRGPSRYVFRVPPIQQVPMHVFLGDAIIFKGYDLPSEVVAPGDTLDLVLYWAALRETDANYTVFAHLLDAEVALVSQFDGLPGDPLHRTYDWWPGYFDWDEWPVPIPEDLAPGTYTLRVGIYDADTIERLPAVDADGTPLGDSILLGPITVVEGQGE
jgi:hypothetical protein